MKGSKKFFHIGLVIIAIMLLLHLYVIHLPDFIEGFMLGSGIALELIGIYTIKHDISKFRNFKMKLKHD
ncbi:hypothetical protein [Heyndrickxia acidicola]|uniref:Uncharacterized protein n=1 Tax=Heyndrickxia acidicola TaxID=209389 RepID=A0ABU6MN69_9BACI|nr:hypothetical protein [Heyndrickxia acidicola]MED1206101.1 hypothetical protein [Heyndrickxia acidicola]